MDGDSLSMIIVLEQCLGLNSRLRDENVIVISLLHTPNILVIFEYVLYLFVGEELNSKAPPVKNLYVRRLIPLSEDLGDLGH